MAEASEQSFHVISDDFSSHSSPTSNGLKIQTGIAVYSICILSSIVYK